jgi:L-fucose mutarotase/ribose pyranase (RbsD/FucU family)
MEPKPITLDQLINVLQEFSKMGYGDKIVTANMEYTVWGASIDNRFDIVDFDCQI